MIVDDRASCRDLDQELFHPTTAAGRGKAIAICQHCPVIDECLDAALAHPTGAYGRIAGGATTEQRAHIAAVRERAMVRVRNPKVAAAYRDLWDGHVGETSDPARRQAARHMVQDQAAVKALGDSRFLSESVRFFGVELRTAVASEDWSGVGHVLDGLPAEHRAALLVEFATELGVA